MSEANLEAACRRAAKRAGCEFIKLHPYVRGLPDRILISPQARCALVELKTATGRLLPSQRIRHALMRRRGFEVHVVRSLDDFSDVMRNLAS